MKTFLAVLVVVLAATSAWLWHERGRQEEGSEPEVALATGNDAVIAVEVPAARPGVGVFDESAGSDHHGSIEETRRHTRLILAGRDPRLAKNDDYQEARRRYLQAAFEQRYPDLPRVLGIPEWSAFQVVELSHEERMRDSEIVIDSTRPEFWQEQAQKAYESDAAISALIGDAKLRAWKDYEDSIGERYRVRELRLKLLDSPEPIGFERSESLVSALYRERKRIEAELEATRGSTGGDPAGPTFAIGDDQAQVELDTERRVLKVAKKELTTYQYEVFREMIERERATQDALDDMFRIGSELLDED